MLFTDLSFTERFGNSSGKKDDVSSRGKVSNKAGFAHDIVGTDSFMLFIDLIAYKIVNDTMALS